jgi:3',5'-cyclic-AMP phosphodiesterase
MGFQLTRRELLRKGALVAATFPAARLLQPGWLLSAEASEGIAVPMNLELVTVTDTTAIITWFTGDPTQPDEFDRPMPVAAPGRVLLGTSPSPADWVEVGAHDPTPYHYVEVTGLVPGTEYYFRAESGGVPATPTILRPDQLVASPYEPTDIDTSNAGRFTTLTPPPGAEILRIAWFNDMHFGEQISGIVTGDIGGDRGFPPGFPVDPENPYWRFMGNAAVSEARARGATFLMVNGDLSNEAEPESLAEIRAALDHFGRLGSPRRNDAGDFLVTKDEAPAYWVTRGNHDRAHRGERYEQGRPIPGTDLYDTFYSTFADSWAPGATTSRFTVLAEGPGTRWRFIGLDSNDADRTGVLATEQLEYLEAQLAAASEPAFVMLHHPTGDMNNLIAFPPAAAGVQAADAEAFREIASRHPDHLVGIYQGHTHRNNRTVSLSTGPVPFFEGASTKEYPGGYTIVRLYEGGYMANFYKIADPEARAWSERSRGEFLGLYPYYTLGALGDRNWVYDADARVTEQPGAAPPPGPPQPEPSPDATTQPPSSPEPPSRPLPATGGGAALLGAAAIGSAAALSRAVRRDTDAKDRRRHDEAAP